MNNNINNINNNIDINNEYSPQNIYNDAVLYKKANQNIFYGLKKNKIPSKNELRFRIIKIIDIAYIFIFYSAAGFILSVFLDRVFPKFNKKKYEKKSSIAILAEICLIFATIGVIVYIVKNLFELVPFPFEKVDGYVHRKVKELNAAIPLAYLIFFYQFGLQRKLLHIATRFMKHSPVMKNPFIHTVDKNQI